MACCWGVRMIVFRIFASGVDFPAQESTVLLVSTGQGQRRVRHRKTKFFVNSLARVPAAFQAPVEMGYLWHVAPALVFVAWKAFF